MIYQDGIRIGLKHSFLDFGIYIAERNIGIPAKKVIKATIPYMNGAYDFSAMNGVPAYEERQITYGFDITGATVEEMEAEKAAVLAWLFEAQDVDIYDDAYPDTHFHGSYELMEWTEDGSQGHLSVTFSVYPFRLGNVANIYTVYEGKNIILTNNGQPVPLYISTSQASTIVSGAERMSISPVTDYNSGMILKNGVHSLSVEKANEFKYPYLNTTLTNNGIAFTDNGDGTITANGTSTDVAWFWLVSSGDKFKPPIGKHRAMGCPANVGANNYRIQYYVYNGSAEDSVYYYDFGYGTTIEVTEKTEYISAAIRVVNGYTAVNVVFNPKLYGETSIFFVEEVV